MDGTNPSSAHSHIFWTDAARSAPIFCWGPDQRETAPLKNSISQRKDVLTCIRFGNGQSQKQRHMINFWTDLAGLRR
jgi:hypothetical protein